MLSPMDEYLIHQIAASVNQVASNDTNWQDRFYFNFMDPGKKVAGLLGMGNFPVMNYFQGILNLIVGDKMICKNFSRPLENDGHRIFGDTFEIKVIEPQRKWSLKMDEPDLNVSFDLTFSGRGEPYEFDKIMWQKDGVPVWEQCHYTQAGIYNGTFKAGDYTFDSLTGIRDRTWGLRNMLMLDFWIWISANFDNCWLTGLLGEAANGEIICFDGAVCMDDGSRDEFKSMTYEIEFFPGMRTPAASSYLIKTKSGRSLKLSAKATHTVYVSIENEIIDLNDKQVIAEKDRDTAIFDQFQELDLGGKPGIGMIEFLVMGGCNKYRDTWKAMRDF